MHNFANKVSYMNCKSKKDGILYQNSIDEDP